MVKPFPIALKNEVCWGAGLTNGAVASAMLIVDSGNREDTPAKVDDCNDILEASGEVVVGSVGEKSCFDTFGWQHTSLEQEGP